MSTPYRAIQWTREKFLFDAAVVSGAGIYLAIFVAISFARSTSPDYIEIATMFVRAFGTLAIVLLHFVLAIGPMSRLNRSFLPLLENRRHLGVFTFLIATVHGVLATLVYHTGGTMNPLASVVLGNGQVFSSAEWPFEIFGFLAFLLLLLLAVTSHDFWIAYLSPAQWKRLHMLVYVAYGFVVLHVSLGVLQETANPLFAITIASGIFLLVWLHRKAAQKEMRIDAVPATIDSDGWVKVCQPAEIPMGAARIVNAGSERIAVFRHWQGISALSNVCAHQGGPLGEGTMVAGCVRCPWHGSLFFPQTGVAPPPATHSVPTFPVKLVDGVIYVSPNPNPQGMEVDPLPVPGQKGRAGHLGSTLRMDHGVVSPRRKEDR